jgi:DNA-binding MarR family transcriptional regulator
MSKTSNLNQALRTWMDVAMHRSMRGWSHHAKSMGLSMAQFSILMQLQHHGQCGISDISERFEISPAAASQHVEKLVQAGLLARLETPEDRRVREIQLTDKGRSLIEKGMTQRHAWLERLAATFGEADRQRIAMALTELTEAARTLDDIERERPGE